MSWSTQSGQGQKFLFQIEQKYCAGFKLNLTPNFCWSISRILNFKQLYGFKVLIAYYVVIIIWICEY